MDNPSDFVSWNDYMGLNAEAGQQMLDRTMEEGAKRRAAAVAAGEGLRQAGRSGGTDANLDAARQGVSRGLASYGEFMGGMADPAKRQALMEKTYGKGGVSWLDSAAAGMHVGDQFGRGAADARDLDARYQKKGGEAQSRLSGDRDANAAAKADDSRRAALLVKQQKALADRDAADEDRRVDDYAKTHDPSYDPNGNTEVSSMGWDLIKNPMRDKKTSINSREYARADLAKAESGAMSLGKRKWRTGSTSGAWDNTVSGGAYSHDGVKGWGSGTGRGSQ